jgi:hypothetical protein
VQTENMVAAKLPYSGGCHAPFDRAVSQEKQAMSSTPDETTRQAGEICVDAAQLRPGVQVRLPLDCPRAISPPAALSTLWIREQESFDAVLLQRFIRAMSVCPPGSIVQLSDCRIAAVVGPASADQPRALKVMVYAPEVPRRQSILVVLAGAEGIAIEGALRLQERMADELDYLLPRRKINWAYLAERP